MRTIIKAVVVFAFCMVCSGCFVQSINKFYTEEDKVEIPSIIGEWKPLVLLGEDIADKKITAWEFKKNAILSYDAQNTFARLDAVYFKVGENFFVDFTAGDPGEVNFFWVMGVALVHSLCKLEVQDGRLILLPFDYDWLNEQLESNQVSLAHVVPQESGQPILFHASSEAWHQFLLEYGGNNKAFSQDIRLVFKR